MQHPSHDQLAEHLHRPATAITGHLGTCAQCQAAITDIDQIETLLRQGLQQDVPRAIWQQIQTTRLAQQQHRQQRRWRILGASVAAGFVLLFALQFWPGQQLNPSAIQSLIARSQQLEAVLRLNNSPGQRQVLYRLNRFQRLEAIDAHLQQAYRDNRSNDEIEALWQQRVSRLQYLLKRPNLPRTIRI